MQELITVSHTCQSCGDVKMITLEPDEKAEDLQGCVCDREVGKSSKRKRHFPTMMVDMNSEFSLK